MKRVVLAMGFILLPTVMWAAKDSKIRMGIGPEMLFSAGYHSFLNDAYQDVSGGSGWLGLRAGVGYQFSDKIIVQPQVSAFFNGVKLQSYYSAESTRWNRLFVPAFAIRTIPYEKDNWAWTFNAELNVPIASTDLSGVSFKTNSPGAGVSSGVRLWKRLNLEVGYKYLPVKVTSVFSGYSGPNASFRGTYNFGGPFLGVYVEF